MTIKDPRRCDVSRNLHISFATHRSIERGHADLQRLDRLTCCSFRSSNSKLTLWLTIKIYRLCCLGTALRLAAVSSTLGPSVFVSHGDVSSRFPNLLALGHARLRRSSKEKPRSSVGCRALFGHETPCRKIPSRQDDRHRLEGSVSVRLRPTHFCRASN